MDDTLKKWAMATSDEDLLAIFEEWLKESQPYHDKILVAQKESYQYYIGNQTDVGEIPTYLCNTVENRIFEGVETLVPIATSAAHQFQVLPGSDDEKSVRRAENLRKVLTRKYETLRIQELLEGVTRNILVRRFGVLKYKWDDILDNIVVEAIDPRLILVPKMRMDPHDLPYVIEIQGYTEEDIKKYFPDININDLTKQEKKVNIGDETDKSKEEYQIFEVWTDKMMAWINSGKILKKQINPYYDFDEEEKKEDVKKEEKEKEDVKKDKKKKEKETKFYNHLDKPEKPYIFFGAFNLSDGPLPDTCLVEIVMPIADAINAQKRSIINNLKKLGNGQVYVDSEAMTQEEADNMTDEPGLVLRGKNLASENRIKREPGVQLPNAHFANLQHSEMVFDNIFGIHASTRGKAEAKTLGQDILSRQQDYTRIDMITRVLNRGVDRLANGLVQLMKMFYEETHIIKIVGEKDASEFIKLNRNDIEDYIEIIVKSGQNLPMDEVSLRTEAVQMWQVGAIAPITLFKRLKFADPEKEVAALLAWKQGQLDMETAAAIKQAEAGAVGGAGPKAETPATAGEGRKTEGVLDVLTRAKEQLGGKTAKPK